MVNNMRLLDIGPATAWGNRLLSRPPGHMGRRVRRAVRASLAFILAVILVALSPVACLAEGPAPQVHIVVWGETLYGIALQYGISVEQLMQANGITNGQFIHAGDQLAIPAPAPSVPDAATPVPADSATGQRTHTVSYGETLSSIALTYGVDMTELAAANGIANPNIIQPGQLLTIPGQGAVVATPVPGDTAPTQPQQPVQQTHVVRAGETLSSIAFEYGVALDQLIATNNIANASLIYPGQSLVIPGAAAGDTTAAPVATPVPASAPSSSVSASGAGYGVCAHMFDVDLDSVMTATEGLGFTWVKQQIEWKLFEPSRGQINWDALDRIVDAATRHGVRVLFSVAKAPNWARPADSDFSVDGPPANPSDYATFVGALAGRYRGRVAAYEVWNEQNLWYEWGGKGKLSASGYVALLQAAYQAIKAADPGAIVVSGGLTPTGVNDGYIAFDDVHYLAQMYAAGAGSYFDALGAHPSGYNNPPGDTPEYNSTDTAQFKGHWSFYFRRYQQLHDVMALNGQGGKPIWFTEFGWSSQTPPPAGYEYAADNSEEEQAAYLRAAIEAARQLPYVGVMFVWNLNYASVTGPQDEKAGFSLVRYDGSLRPAYVALAAMSK
ncbi:MAG: LysM peptidoglycan-binding domain-containing protein [Anaerolineae bacterium]